MDSNRKKAFSIYKESGGKATSKYIADYLNEKLSTIKYWRRTDEWKKKLNGGAPKGNKNALGNKGGHGAPEGNQYRREWGLYSKYMPKKVVSIYKDIITNEFNNLDILWHEICQHYATIIEAHRILNIKSNKDHTKVLKKETYSENLSTKEYEVNTAFDKQVKKLKALSEARKTLATMINKYDNLLNKNWDLATEEQKARIEVLKDKIDKKEINPIKIEFVKASERNGNS